MPGEDETAVRARLRTILEPAFELYEEAWVRHALFRRRRLRVDVLGIPRDPHLADIALAFETKSERGWEVPAWAQCLKQASDYVLSTVEPDLPAHAGKPIMAAFVFPAPRWTMESQFLREGDDPKGPFLSGMAHMAGYHRVGLVRAGEYRELSYVLSMGPNEVWVSSRGWRANARNILAGKRQIGSQRFPILEELKGLDR